jgi:sugar phosphate isomerase/epimerase
MTKTASNLPQLGLTLFSLTLEMREPGYSLEGMIKRAAELDLGPGLEMVGFQSLRGWPNLDDATVDHVRGLVERNGFTQTAMSCNLDLARNRAQWMDEQEGIEYLEAQIVTSKRLGFPIAKSAIITTESFVARLAEVCERHQMKFGVELHSPESVDSPSILELREIFEKIDSPRLGWVPDFSSSMRGIPPSLLAAHRESGMPEELTQFASEIWNSDTTMQEKFGAFAQEAPKLGATPADMGKLNMILTMHGRMDPHRWAEIMDRVIHVHGKFYGLNEQGEEPSIDHAAIVDVLLDAGYSGSISSEWEGHAYTDAVSGWDMVRGQQSLLAKLINQRAAVRAS